MAWFNVQRTALALQLLVLTGATAWAQAFDGIWRGEMSCAKLSITKGSQRVAFELMVTGGAATFARKVWNQDRSTIVGTEEGSGEVSATGDVKLTAVWKSAVTGRYTYTASYGGLLTGRTGRLTGQQIWIIDGKTENRDCSITLRR